MADDRAEKSNRSAQSTSHPEFALAGASRHEADAYLRKQRQLADLQIDELRREDKLRHWSFVIRHISDILKLSFELAVAAIVTFIVIVIGSAIWSAANDNGLVIEAFSVPPDLAAKGLTGEIIADKILDRLSAFQAQTVSGRAAESYANNWGNDIKVQIPDTGVSIGEFNRYLQQWLGHQTHIAGEVYHIPSGLAVTARAGSDASPVFTGGEADLETLVQKAAEHIYRITQPYRYAIYLFDHKRYSESKEVLRQVIATGAPLDQAWATIGMDANAETDGDYVSAAAWLRKGIQLNPNLVLTRSDLMGVENNLGHDEESLAAAYGAQAAIARGDSSMSAASLATVALGVDGNIAALTGDMPTVLKVAREITALPDFSGSLEGGREAGVIVCGSLHDATCLNVAVAAYDSSSDPGLHDQRAGALQVADITLQRWPDVMKSAPSVYADLLKGGAVTRTFAVQGEAPVYAIAAANVGDRALAHHLIDTTPADCVICLRARGQIDAVEKNWNGSAYWFARAVKAAPSTPLGRTDWGAMLLQKGDYDGAIAEFERANKKGPHFADPLEMWGEALIAKNRADLALAKFEGANNYAPRWGRLHLKWGEALLWSGDKRGAQRQFAIARALNLTPTEKSEIAGLAGG